MTFPKKTFAVYRLIKINREPPPLLSPLPKVSSVEDVWRIFEEAADPLFDLEAEVRGRTIGWHLRTPIWLEESGEMSTDVGSVLLARSTPSLEHNTVTDDGPGRAVTVYEEPHADFIRIVFLAKRELVLVEQNYKVTNSAVWMGKLTEILENAAAELDFDVIFELRAIPSLVELGDALRSFSKVTRIKLSLILPNPDHSEYYEDLEQSMIDSEIEKIGLVLEAPSNGINLSNPAGIASQSIAMGEAGYKNGEMVFEGQDEDGQDIAYETGEQNLLLDLPAPTGASEQMDLVDGPMPEFNLKLLAQVAMSELASLIPVEGRVGGFFGRLRGRKDEPEPPENE